ncbi:MAG TPA: lipoate--protein ligase family protein [Bacteroidales bacterium]
MKVLISPSNNPYFNIAAEEYLLHHSNDELLFLYVNENAVIVGKHQNTLAEINYRYIIENNIPVIRRISGGGTVFHDLGNLNFAFFSVTEEGKQIDFEKFSKPILDALYESGIKAYREGKNDLRSAEFKISGNAGHVYKNRAIHHGTLLVEANLERLKDCLKVKPKVYIDKAVQSIRSSVTNLRDIYHSISITELKDKIVRSVDGLIVEPEADFDKAVNSLVQSKFQTWEWNYAYSPAYTFVSYDEHDVYFKLNIEQGIINKVEIINKNYAWAKTLIGIRHQYLNVSEALTNEGLKADTVWQCF